METTKAYRIGAYLFLVLKLCLEKFIILANNLWFSMRKKDESTQKEY